MFIPMYGHVERLEKGGYVSQMHRALIDIRQNCFSGPEIAKRREAIAKDVLNIPAYIRLDDEYETSCPPELRTPFLDILYKTFKTIAENSEDGLLCSILANHAHNIPGCISIIKKNDGTSMSTYSLIYYWECERPYILYGLRGGNSDKKDYGPKMYRDLFAKEWLAIEQCLPQKKKVKKEDNEEEDVSKLIETDWARINPIKMQYLMYDMIMGGAKKKEAEQSDILKQETDDEGDAEH
ncbi:hypothetical protein ACHAXT_009384 [Thalassiosira profunda]